MRCKLVEPFGVGTRHPTSPMTKRSPAPGTSAGEAKQRHFDRRSGALVGAAAAGLEALLIEREDGREPHDAGDPGDGRRDPPRACRTSPGSSLA